MVFSVTLDLDAFISVHTVKFSPHSKCIILPWQPSLASLKFDKHVFLISKKKNSHVGEGESPCHTVIGSF